MDEKRPYSKVPKIRIDSKGMFATINIATPDADEADAKYKVADLLAMIEHAGVVHGIDQDMVLSLCEMPLYDSDIVIAVGTPATEGTNGYYDYHFSQEFSKKPTIRPDGSADFLSMKIVEVVHEDELIATYHPAVPGVQGITVRGMIAEPKRVRDMPPLGGRGFHRAEDNVHYYSDMDGKIVMQGARILISPVLEIEHDADMTVGNIEFKGDVIIHGGVKHGVKIHATGMITVHGLVEHCYMESGKDIFLLSGVKGGEKTTIHAAGSITAEFIEYAMVSCKKELRADVLFNCMVNCDSKVIVTSGKRASIIGGYVNAVKGISALSIGNSFGTVTHITVGLDENRMRETITLAEKIRTIEANIAKIKKGIEDFEKLSEQKGVSYKDDPRRLQLLRVKIRDEAIVSEDRIRLEELFGLLEAGKKATIKVYDTVYAGVTVKMSDQYVQMTDYQKSVEFMKTDTGIKLDVLDEPIPDE